MVRCNEEMLNIRHRTIPLSKFSYPVASHYRVIVIALSHHRHCIIAPSLHQLKIRWCNSELNGPIRIPYNRFKFQSFRCLPFWREGGLYKKPIARWCEDVMEMARLSKNVNLHDRTSLYYPCSIAISHLIVPLSLHHFQRDIASSGHRTIASLHCHIIVIAQSRYRPRWCDSASGFYTR